MKHTLNLLEHKLFKVLAVSWTFLIFYFCLQESPNVPKFSLPNKDKVVHFIFYFVFVYLWTKSLKNKNWKAIVIVLVLALVIGITIEFLQENLTQNRTFDGYDILANSIGAITSFFYVKKFYAIKNEFKISLW